MKSHFTQKQIIRIVAKTKAKKTLLRGDYSFYANLSRSAQRLDKKFEIDEICPPRKQWIRLHKRERVGLSPIKLIEITVYRTIVLKMRHQNDQRENWVQKLEGLIREIQNAILEEGVFEFSEPSIIPQEKSSSVYRPLSLFTLKEKIVASLTCSYLTTVYEKLWEVPNCSYAFRKSKQSITHHTAVQDILKYKQNHELLFASECDIKKFYDSVDHVIFKTVFSDSIECLRRTGIEVDAVAVNVLLSYLECYSFLKTVIEKEDIWLGRIKYRDPRAQFEWIQDDLKYKGISESGGIGVPQGGALSCFIANVMLHSVDLKLKEENDGSLFYSRYCDDMIVLHPEKEKCEYFLRVYMDALSGLNLFYHQPSTGVYGRNFWEYKSKATYCWSKKDVERNCVPWLSFVGYQIRYDNVLRARPKAIAKEKMKQVAIVDKILKNINIRNIKKAEAALSVHTNQIFFRARKKLLAMSVGIISEQKIGEGNKFCWVDGFRILKKEKFVVRQIRSLDRNRVKQLNRLRNKLKLIKSPNVKKNKVEVEFKKYDTYLLSYFRQFADGRK